MQPISVRLLGIGACLIETPEARIYVDAFNEYGKVTDLDENDILLFTHDDGDHFKLEPFMACYRNNRVVAPPSVMVKLLGQGVPYERLFSVFPPEYLKPETVMLDAIKIHAYQTPHFMDWHPIHVSYRIEAAGKSIYITGDSHLAEDMGPVFTGVDLLILSLIRWEVVVGKMDSATGSIHHLAEITEAFYRYQPRHILCNHLLNCSWAVDSREMKMRLAVNGIKKVSVFESSDDYIHV